MLVKFTTEVELSVNFEGESVTIYEGDSTEPEHIISIEELIEDFLDMVCDTEGKVYFSEKEEAQALLKALKKAQDAIQAAL